MGLPAPLSQMCKLRARGEGTCLGSFSWKMAQLGLEPWSGWRAQSELTCFRWVWNGGL